MLQESVYCKIALNGTVVKSIVDSVHKNSPPEGFGSIIVCNREAVFKNGFDSWGSKVRGFG